MAVQMLYQEDLGEATPTEIVHAFEPRDLLVETAETVPGERSASPASTAQEERAAQRAFEYAQRLLTGTLEHRQQIDELIASQADNWRLERMTPVDRNILRLAVFELLHEPDVPHLVVLDEAIELAKRYGTEQSGSFVNGVLDGLLKSSVAPESA